MKLVARYKKQDYTAEVFETGEGLRIRLADGREFKSVSAAGSHVMGGTACNGWRFWTVEGQNEVKKPSAESKVPSRVARRGRSRHCGRHAMPPPLRQDRWTA